MKRSAISLAVALSIALPLGTVGVAEAGTGATAAVEGRLPARKFPLGVPALPKYKQKSVHSGIDLFTVRHGRSTDGYTVTVLINGKESGNAEKAAEVAAAVEAAGLTPSVQRYRRPDVADYPGAEAYMVRVGLWPLKKKKAAEKVVKQLREAGIAARVDYLGDDGFKTTGPWNIRILMVDPRRFRGSYQATLGRYTGKRETTSAMAKQAGAIAAVNGGFFSIHAPKAFSGDPTGISVVGGRLLSEAVRGRTALVLNGRRARITELDSSVTVRAPDGSTAKVTGVNRVAGPNELVLYTHDLGTKTPRDHGVEAVIDDRGRIVRVRTAGAAVPRGMQVLHGTGQMAEWLEAVAQEGQVMRIVTQVVDLRTGRRIPLTPTTHILGGGINILRNGRQYITAAADGMASDNMILRRHPRTLAGVTKSGALILATIDGRDPGVTVGANLLEAAQLMRWLGAKNAINLDGGGSTTMVVNNKVVNSPSDGAERPVGDALLIVPR
jgi:Exopolysaccharide biosynthesis protein related to N-acetylglucosamine-1-phosphodiester alpha-N-acetylglucosaminidase